MCHRVVPQALNDSPFVKCEVSAEEEIKPVFEFPQFMLHLLRCQSLCCLRLSVNGGDARCCGLNPIWAAQKAIQEPYIYLA